VAKNPRKSTKLDVVVYAPTRTPTRPKGRPSSYSSAAADYICSQLAGGKSLRTICSAGDVPNSSTVQRWLDDREDFRAQYARARLLQAHHYAEEVIDISDEPVADMVEAQRNRGRIDARKWYASKLAPKDYGDKVDLEHSGQIAIKRVVADL